MNVPVKSRTLATLRSARHGQCPSYLSSQTLTRSTIQLTYYIPTYVTVLLHQIARGFLAGRGAVRRPQFIARQLLPKALAAETSIAAVGLRLAAEEAESSVGIWDGRESI